MHNLTNLPSKAWVSLLWSKYKKLSEPLKEGFVNLAHNMAKEAVNQTTDTSVPDPLLTKQDENV